MMRPGRLLIFLSLLLSACAQVAEITGGEKDILPPELIAAEPPHLTTNFTGNKITLVFNERIQLERVRDRLLISPPLENAPNVRLLGARTITMTLNGPLKANTTYSFAIGEAVRDLTEGNAAAGLSHVISTGEYVDSLIIAGRVINAFTGLPEKDVLVLVHDVTDTTSLRSSRPAYATRSDSQGRFLLQHLRKGEYELYALRDQNGNYRYDLPNEEIAFLHATVNAELPDSLATEHELLLFKEASAVQQIREARVIPDGAFQIIFDRPASSVKIIDVAREGGELAWYEEWNSMRDSLLLWPSDTAQLGLGRYQIGTEDGIIDTIRYRSTEVKPFFLALQASLEEVATGPVINMRSSRPIGSIDASRFQLIVDSVPVDLQIQRDTMNARKFSITAGLEPGARAILEVLPRGVIDIYGGYNDTLNLGLGRAAEASTGILRINIAMEEAQIAGPFLLHLLNAQGAVTKEAALQDLDQVVVWERLMPGMAKLRLIEDRNGNGHWDPGILKDRVLPERLWINAETVNIRAGWDLGVDWSIGGPPGRTDDPQKQEP